MTQPDGQVYSGSLSEPPAIPASAIARVLELLQSGRLFRYGEDQDGGSDVACLEEEFASLLGRRYCVAVNSCGSALFAALKSSGVEAGTPVLFNAFTLAPVPGAIAHAGGIPIPVEIRSDLTIDLQHLKHQQRQSQARYLLLSYMRGHIPDMDRVTEVCRELNLTLIEDCAHTMGAAWDGQLTGRFGDVACFSAQSFKHVNAGEGGLLVTDNERLAASAILYSGSYALYSQHKARPALDAFEDLYGQIPNCSLRMSNLAAALIRPQLELLADRNAAWQNAHQRVTKILRQVPGLSLPDRDPRENYVPSSLQFSLPGLVPDLISAFVKRCRSRGVHVKWFGVSSPDGFTEQLEHWRFADAENECPNTQEILSTLFDLRLPLTLDEHESRVIGAIIRDEVARLKHEPIGRPKADSPEVAEGNGATASVRDSDFRSPVVSLGKDVHPLWTAVEVSGATEGRWLIPPPEDWRPLRVSYDVTAMSRGNLVVCMHPKSWGRNRPDTAQLADKITSSGAVGAIIQPEQAQAAESFPDDFPLLVVDDTRQALRRLCHASRSRMSGMVVGLTGTVGKTTSREMLRHVLEPQGGAVATRGNNNNIAGVERTMAYVPADVGYAIIEMGFGQPLNGVSFSSEQVRPHIALITSIGLAHLDVFGDQSLNETEFLQLVAGQKLGILDGMEPGSTLVANCDSRVIDQVKESAECRGVRLVTFGDHGCDARLVNVIEHDSCTEVTADILGRAVDFQLKLPGHHMAMNALGVLGTVAVAGGNVESAAAELAEFSAVGGRAKVGTIPVQGGGVRFIDDSFNATPDSVRSTLRLLATVEVPAGGRRIAVLGDILHLGTLSARLHASLAGTVIESGIDRVFTIGSEMEHLHHALPENLRGGHAEDLQALYRDLRRYLESGDALTLKASTPVGLGQVARALRLGSPSLGSSATRSV